MDDNLYRYFNILSKKSRAKYVMVQVLIVIGGLAVLAGVIAWICKNPGEVLNDMVASFVGVMAAFLLVKLVVYRLQKDEDRTKVSYNNADMWEQYGTHYRRQFMLHDRLCTVYCDKVVKAGEYKELKVEDHPNEYFELDPFIKAQYFTLIEAHSRSKTTDSMTVRLMDFEPATKANHETATIHTMRSTYLAHMLTNRALDYPIKANVSIRRIFENADWLYPAKRSKMSNHFGVNALVFLKDGEEKQGWLLLPQRGGDATVAKNKVTASIATRLEMPDKTFAHGYDDKLTTDYVTRGCIEDCIAGALRVREEWWQEPGRTDIRFLGLSRDIYEGGKPTLFYVVYLDATPEEYSRETEAWSSLHPAKKKAKRVGPSDPLPLPAKSIDSADIIHIARWQSVRMQELPGVTNSWDDKEHPCHNQAFDKAQLEFTDWAKKNEEAKHFAFLFEQNMISNFWFLLGCPEPKA